MSTSSPLSVTILGSGTSAGVPMIGCHCPVCSSSDPRDRRTRPSIAVHYDNQNFLIDTTPELRLQACANNLDLISAVIYTHAHADHIFGLDDVRRYNTLLQAPLPLYATPQTLTKLQTAFPYAFTPAKLTEGMYRPELTPHLIEGPFTLHHRIWTPIPLIHGKVEVLGFRINNFAYCTDCSEIPAPSQALLQNLDVLIIDALRPRPHPTHFSYAQAIDMINLLKPRRAYFTHLTHDVAHTDIDNQLPPHIRASYDGLRITLA